MSQSTRGRKSIPGLPDGKRVQLFRAVEEVMRDDPVLAREVKTWRSFEGVPGDLLPPSRDQCPWVRLKLLDRPIVPAGQTRVRIDIAVQIEIAVKGTNLNDLVNLWEAIEDSLFSFKPYLDTTVARFLALQSFEGYQNLPVGPVNPTGVPGVHGGMYDYRFEEPAFFPAGEGELKDATMLAGIGRLVGYATKPA